MPTNSYSYSGNLVWENNSKYVKLDVGPVHLCYNSEDLKAA